MSEQLELFEDHRPNKSLVKFSGAVPFKSVLAQSHRLGSVAFFLVKGTVTTASYTFDNEDNLIKGEAVRIELAQSMDAHAAIRLLVDLDRKVHEAAGLPSLPLADSDVDTDTGEIEHLERAFEGQSSRS